MYQMTVSEPCKVSLVYQAFRKVLTTDNCDSSPSLSTWLDFRIT